MLEKKTLTVSLLWPGSREARDAVTFEGSRFRGVADALEAVGIKAVPEIYNDDLVNEVREQLFGVDGVLVWVNPIEQGRDRTVLDAMLRQVADSGVFVSAHPDIILKMGTKEVLYKTRAMSWGTDTHLYRTVQEAREQIPLRLAEGKPRVLKQYRGNGGYGVWKVECHPQDARIVRVRHALRGSVEQDIPLAEFLAECEAYIAASGCLVDQAYQERLTDGMVRCYLVQDRVVGFGHQAINALYPAAPGAPASEAPQPGSRLYYPATKLEFQAIRIRMEEEWLGALCRILEIEKEALPIIWDADFLYGPKTATGEDTYVLCEINVSSVSPFPEEALGPLAQTTKEQILGRL